MRANVVASWDIPCVSFAETLFMGIMNFTCICLQNIILVTYVKGRLFFFTVLKGIFLINIPGNFSLMNFSHNGIYRQHPGQYEYYKNYDDLEA